MSAASNVTETSDAILRFDTNTRKNLKRLGTEQAINLRLQRLEKSWANFDAAWGVWRAWAAAQASLLEDQDEYTFEFNLEFYESVEDACDDARVSLSEHRKLVLGAPALQVMTQAQSSASLGAVAADGNSLGAQGLGVGSASRADVGNIGGGGVAAQDAHPPPLVYEAAAPARDIVQPALRLPTLQPPSFNGELEGWVSFRDVFSAIVIRNNSLSDVHRLHLLRASCVGEAADVIAGIALVEGHFAIAWQALERKYENERLLVFRLIEKMLNLPAMKKDCSVELGRLLNGTNHAVRALRVLGRQTDQLGDVLVVLTVTKLDITTRTAWEREQGANKNMPSFEQLDEFLHGVLGSLEAMRGWSGSGGGASVAPSARNSNQPRRTAHAHVVATTTGGGSPCELCSGQHRLYSCQQFQARSIAERRAFVGEHRLCFRCISATHRAQVCTSRYLCRVCGQNHHTLLHLDAQQSGAVAGSGAVARGAGTSGAGASSGGSGAAAVAAAGSRRATPFSAPPASTNMCTAASQHNPHETLLPTAWVEVTTADGRKSRLRALIDQGSQVSLIARKASQRLGMRCEPTDVCITGVAESSGRTFGAVTFDAAACFGGKAVSICALVMATITADLPSVNVVKSTHPTLANLQLADPDYWQSGQVDLLLGAAVVSEILRNGIRRADGLTAQETLFGWMVSGSSGTRAQMTATVACASIELDGLLQRFWEQEEGSPKVMLSVEDERCEAIFKSTTSRGADGRYTLDLPFRQGGRELGESYNGAVRRLKQMEKKFVLYPELHEGYKSFMSKYLSLGHMERIADDDINVRPHCYLPHHAVFKPDSTTTKLRVVFDATAATTNGRGLNSWLLKGPRLQENLASILMRWRGHCVCFSADIEKMYRQIGVKREHQEFQRIVWRDSESEPIGHFRLKTVTYGTASAPYMAVKAIQRLAEDEAARYPRAASTIMNDFYVDDCLSGAGSVEEATLLKDELLKVMAAGGMRLLKWSSNSRELLKTLPDEYVECRAPLVIDEDESIKALGVRWHPASDEFAYVVNRAEITAATTKRKMLSEIAKLFDPLGLLAPVITTAKTMMQTLWLTGLGWDDDLPDEVVERWRRFQQELPTVEKIRIKRWFGSDGGATELQLHGFSDASMIAYAACVYVRARHPDGKITVTLLATKTKVAPIKQQSIPRLELCGALLLARLLVTCREALRCADVEVHAWTDSTVVLAWIRRHANVWQTFVANRVSEIQSTMQATQWRHVPGVENPADVASRGIMPAEMREHALWWTGPSWLVQAQDQWPQQQELIVDEELLEVKKKIAVVNVATKEVQMSIMADLYSSWRRLLRITAYCRRMVPARRQNSRCLLASEIEEARIVWLLMIQAHEFGNVVELVSDNAQMRKLGVLKLMPIIGGDGLLRVGGRLSRARLSYDEKHPIIVPGKNKTVQLLILDAHERTCHGGPQATSAYLHQRYWLVSERRNVRACVHRCVTCVKSRPHKRTQLMGSLPEERVRPTRSFTHTAIDYAGPIWSRTSRGRGQKAHKSWVAVFVCMCSKAVHLELVSELTSTAFVAAFRRFTSRRGLCSDVYCDNGTNFVGADRELREQLKKAMQDEGWRALLADSGTKFHFSPPGSPHFNGLAEASVRMAKTAMRRTIGESKLTFEEMSTLLAQIEAALNSRPLSIIPTDSEDPNVLTPGHFLVGEPLNAVPEPNIVDVNVPAVQRWRVVQQMVQHFWGRWSREYLHQLQERKKWQTVKPDLAVNDVVLIQDENKHSTYWKMGRVTATHPGADGCVRVVTLKTANGSIKRAVAKLCALPVHAEATA